MLGMLGEAHHGYQHVQNTPVKLQYDHSWQQHQRSKDLFMTKLTSRNREHSLARATWCSDEAKGQLWSIIQHGPLRALDESVMPLGENKGIKALARTIIL